MSTTSKNGADGLKDKIRQPENQIRGDAGMAFEGLAEDEEAVIHEHEHERHGHARAGLTPVGANPEGNSNERESNAGERKCHAPVQLDEGGGDIENSLGFEFADFTAQLGERHVAELWLGRIAVRAFEFHLERDFALVGEGLDVVPLNHGAVRLVECEDQLSSGDLGR